MGGWMGLRADLDIWEKRKYLAPVLEIAI